MWTRIKAAFFGWPEPWFASRIDLTLAERGDYETYDWTDNTLDGGEL